MPAGWAVGDDAWGVGRVVEGAFAGDVLWCAAWKERWLFGAGMVCSKEGRWCGTWVGRYDLGGPVQQRAEAMNDG